MEGRAQRARPVSTRSQQDRVCAAIVLQGRILQQQGPSRIRHASRAQQMLMHLQGAQFRELAGATQATLVSMENHAQRAGQERTRRQRDQPHAACVTQARIQQLSGRQRYRHASFVRQTPARLRRAQSALAMRATRGLTEVRAQRARQERTRRQRDQMHAAHVTQARIQHFPGHRHAAIVCQSLGRLRGAQSALAMRATRGLTERAAQRARQERTRRQRDQLHAAHVTQARIHQLSGPQSHRHASFVCQPPDRMEGAQSARATRATRGLTEAYAQSATQGSTRTRQELAAAKAARLTPTRLLRALRSQTAPATRAGRGLMEGHARRAWQASTRAMLVMRTAAAAQKARARQGRAQL